MCLVVDLTCVLSFVNEGVPSTGLVYALLTLLGETHAS